jgi:integrase
MPSKNLTAISVERMAPPKRGQVDIFDKGFPGLALRVSYGGRKAWSFVYRYGGKVRRLQLGTYPALSLAEAREAWRVARQQVERGNDPNETQRREAAAMFEAVMAEWLSRDQAKNRSLASVKRLLNVDVLPHWRNRRINEIGRRDVLDVIDRVVDRGSPVMARQLHVVLHRLFRWSVGRGIIEANPLTDLDLPENNPPRKRFLTDAELAVVMRAAGELGAYGAVVQLLALTGCRRQEIADLTWDEIDGDVIRLDSHRRKNGEPLTVKLSAPAKAIIDGMDRKGDRVFSGSRRAALGHWARLKEQLDGKVAELSKGPLPHWNLHDLRRTLAVGLQKLGVGLQVVERVLGHGSRAGSRSGVVGIYQAYSYDKEAGDALAAWGVHVMGLLDAPAQRRRA